MLTAVLVAFFGIANAQNTQWFGYYSGQRCFEGLKPGIYVVNIAGRSLKVMIE